MGTGLDVPDTHRIAALAVGGQQLAVWAEGQRPGNLLQLRGEDRLPARRIIYLDALVLVEGEGRSGRAQGHFSPVLARDGMVHEEPAAPHLPPLHQDQRDGWWSP